MNQRKVVECAALKGAAEAAVAGLEADLAFCHPAIRGLRSVDTANGSLELEIAAADDGELADLRKQVVAVVERSVRSYRFAEPTPPVWRHDAASRYAGGRAAVDEFVRRYTRQTGPGQQVLLGPAARLRSWMDSRASALAHGLGGEEWHTPNFDTNDELLTGTNYFASHPQLVTFCYHLAPHFERIEAFAAAAKNAPPVTKEAFGDMQPAGFILIPAVCHNIFRALRGERIAGGRVITALCDCYRYEGFRFQPLLRQWEYSVREIVFAGSTDWVEASRLKVVELVQALVTEFDLDATLEVATDPFFVSAAASARAFQLMGATKIELRLRVDEGITTAAASFNRHERHFSGPMDIRSAADGEVIDTACVGFGIERWMAALIARWGADPDGWPMRSAGRIETHD